MTWRERCKLSRIYPEWECVTQAIPSWFDSLSPAPATVLGMASELTRQQVIEASEVFAAITEQLREREHPLRYYGRFQITAVRGEWPTLLSVWEWLNGESAVAGE